MSLLSLRQRLWRIRCGGNSCSVYANNRGGSLSVRWADILGVERDIPVWVERTNCSALYRPGACGSPFDRAVKVARQCAFGRIASALNCTNGSAAKRAKYEVSCGVLADLLVRYLRANSNVRSNSFGGLLSAFLGGREPSSRSCSASAVATNASKDVVIGSSQELAGDARADSSHHALKHSACFSSLVRDDRAGFFRRDAILDQSVVVRADFGELLVGQVPDVVAGVLRPLASSLRAANRHCRSWAARYNGCCDSGREGAKNASGLQGVARQGRIAAKVQLALEDIACRA